MTLVTRAAWGARLPHGAMNVIGPHPAGVAIHWEGPRMGSRPHALCDQVVRSIQAFHQDSRGWADIAYNYLVCEHGYVYEGRGWSRGSAANGTTAANASHYAICALVGDGDRITAPLLQGIKDARQICLNAGAGSEVKGHRDFFATTCPGDGLYARVRKGEFSALPTRVVKTVSRAVTKTRTELTSKAILRQGSRGVAVKALQGGLNRVFPAYSHLAVDGDFGPATDKVVREFQRRTGLSVDGVVGPVTRSALKRVGITF